MHVYTHVLRGYINMLRMKRQGAAKWPSIGGAI